MKISTDTNIGGYRITKKLYDAKTGGSVWSAYDVNLREEKDNFAACRVIADTLSWTCVLIPPAPNKKTPDMIRADDLTFWEIKTSHSGNPKTIDKALHEARRQAENAIIRIATAQFDVAAVKAAVEHRKERSHFAHVILIAGDHLEFI